MSSPGKGKKEEVKSTSPSKKPSTTTAIVSDSKKIAQLEDEVKKLKATISKNETQMVDLTKDLNKQKKDSQQLVQDKKTADAKLAAMQKEVAVLKKRPD